MFAASMPLLHQVPYGDGRPVLVLPGFTAGDRSTEPLRWFLRDRGYDVFGWELGRNFGPSAKTVEGLLRRLAEVRGRCGEPVTLIGWSLGGVYARLLAERMPLDVRHVLALGAPFRVADTSDTNAGVLYRALSYVLESPPTDRLRTVPGYCGPPQVPSSSFYTHGDGVVPWESCVDDPGPFAENIEVCGSHMGLGHNPAVLRAIADRLRLAPGCFRPYAVPAARAA